MVEPLIYLLFIGFIVATHVLVWKWARHLQERHGDNPKKIRIGMLIIMLSILTLFFIIILVLKFPF